MTPTCLNRRTVLKGIGASVVGSIAFAGTATATVDVTNGTIDLIDTATYHDFDPDDAAVDASALPATVTWHNKSHVEHDVALVDANGNRLLTSQALRHGDDWEVKFESSSDGYKLSQTNAHGNAAGPPTATVSSDGLPLTMKCDLHDAPQAGAEMRGTLDITDL